MSGQEARHPAPPPPLPRIAIQFCTQCKWMLRATYFAQELLSTFSTALGEIALQPATGGVFTVTIEWQPGTASTAASAEADAGSGGGVVEIQTRVLWDRKVDGGFPETKELKRRVRDVIEPGRDLGHVDRDHPRPGQEAAAAAASGQQQQQQQAEACSIPSGDAAPCEDCR